MYNIKRLKVLFRHMLEEGHEVNPQIEAQRYSVKVVTAVTALEELLEEGFAKHASIIWLYSKNQTYQRYTYRKP